MPEIDVRLVDRQSNRLTDLPQANIGAVRWVLNEEGDTSFTINPFAFGADLIKCWDTEIQVWWDGVLGWWGVIWSGGGTGPGELTFQCKGLASLLYKRFIDRLTLVYGDATTLPSPTLVEQFSIAMDLINYAQDESYQAHRDLNIGAAAYSPSGVGRTMQYKRDEHKNILDLLKEFPTLYNGFDWDIDILPTGERLWHPYFPKKGVFRPEFKMEYTEFGNRNMANFDYKEDMSAGATQAYTTGGSVNGQKIEENYEDAAASAEHGVMQAIISQGSTLDRPTLLDRSRREVDLRKDPVIMPGITAAREVDMDMFGIVQTGDWIPVYIDYGRYQVNANHRVQAITWNPNDTLSLAFAEVVP